MPKVSVIVPVYQVEAYLAECLDSILAGTFGDYELILVDDGTKDNCPAIMDAYAAKDSRIRGMQKQVSRIPDAVRQPAGAETSIENSIKESIVSVFYI